ncbi:uncharacterized protein LOC111355628 [Spodoptera litura]|uniref:Uncharacterized protein LOC111355628 n=1 Tax=Spodoptera litura TaxID=69820 RepID=A0A9J7ECB0_SPOLT|nr:uncharacterized protein LOC111355628 [Spodoptera litura]
MLRMTPLHWAVQNGHAAAAAELLRAGADPTLRNKFRKSPLELARRLRRADLVRLLEDALRQREAARSVSALVDEQMAEVSTAEPEIETFDAVQRIQDIKLPRPKQNDKAVKEESKLEGGGADGAGELLRRHGITLLPADPGGTVLSALQGGRTVVLSDAGKLMLKESSESPSPASNKAGTASSQPKGVVLTATPVKSPPKPGVKIFTLNNKLLAVPKDNKIPVKKIINPQDMQVKFVQLPPDAKLVSPSKIVPMKAKSRMAVRQGVTSPSARPAVKIIMNKSNFHRLLATAGATQVHIYIHLYSKYHYVEIALTEDAAPPDTSDADSPAALRAQLAAATRALAAARRDLRLARARLAHYERLHDL